MPRFPLNMDGVAIGMSSLCLVHCLGLPILFALLPSASAMFTIPETFHQLMVLLAVPTSIYAVAVGFGQHRHVAPLLGASAGLLLLIAGAFMVHVERAEVALTVLGGIVLAASHIVNHAMRNRVAKNRLHAM